jgi:hypothetical protein
MKLLRDSEGMDTLSCFVLYEMRLKESSLTQSAIREQENLGADAVHSLTLVTIPAFSPSCGRYSSVLSASRSGSLGSWPGPERTVAERYDSALRFLLVPVFSLKTCPNDDYYSARTILAT